MTHFTMRDVADILNEALALDPEAVASLAMHGVACNEGLQDHPRIILSCSDRKLYFVGLLNGLISSREERLVMELSPSRGELIGFGLCGDYPECNQEP